MNKITLTVTTLHPFQKAVKKLFLSVLKDYCLRFDVKVKEAKWDIWIAFVAYDPSVHEQGMTIYGENNRILIQVRDPFLEDHEPQLYTNLQFLQIICHEFVHACQHMTGRKGIKVKYKVVDPLVNDAYFFDPMEIEARVLEQFYCSLFAEKMFLKQIKVVENYDSDLRCGVKRTS